MYMCLHGLSLILAFISGIVYNGVTLKLLREKMSRNLFQQSLGTLYLTDLLCYMSIFFILLY